MDAYDLEAPADRPPARVRSSVCAYVADVDAVFAAAVERGAVAREAPSTFVTGDRFASIHDPFGHRWAILSRVEASPLRTPSGDCRTGPRNRPNSDRSARPGVYRNRNVEAMSAACSAPSGPELVSTQT